VKDFYKGLNNDDFESISNLISDNIRITEGTYNLTNSKASFYTQFQWDSVFTPQYEIVEISDYEYGIEATISKECQRILFLMDTAMVYKVKINFRDDKIIRMNTEEYISLDFNKWQNNLDELLEWMKEDHPELIGSQNDLTLAGAQNYLKAINLFKELN